MKSTKREVRKLVLSPVSISQTKEMHLLHQSEIFTLQRHTHTTIQQYMTHTATIHDSITTERKMVDLVQCFVFSLIIHIARFASIQLTGTKNSDFYSTLQCGVRHHQLVNILKALTSTHWGKNKETLTNTYKTVTRPILEYAGTIYAPIISDKQLTALQVTQNQGLRIATGCTSDTNINHIHDETKILPIEKHLRLHSSQQRQKASHPDHPLHRLTTQPQPPRLKKEDYI